MRIAYVSLHWPRTISSGVGKKITRQIGAWRAAGHEVDLFMHTVHRQLDAPLIPGKTFLYRSGGMAGEWQRISAVHQLLKAVQFYHPNIIYLRYGMYVYPIHRLANVAPLVEELNTNDLSQHERLGSLYDLYNRSTRGLILKRTSGLICMSNELARSPSNAAFRKPTLVIGDSIDLDNIPPLPAPQNIQPRVVFIGSPDSPWQGVDKLIALASRFPDISIHLIGYDQIDGYTSLPDNLHLYGYLDKMQYTKILRTMDCAISSLALHRIHLTESSPLKTRECLALGLPIVLPYKDTDLDHLNCKFLLKIPNKEDNIQTHGEAIRDFAYQMRGQRADREILAGLIDSKYKEQKRLSFFSEILQTAH
jgi:hypothetical protein